VLQAWVYPFVQTHLAMVCTRIRIWPSEPWCGEHVLEGGRGVRGCEGERVCSRWYVWLRQL